MIVGVIDALLWQPVVGKYGLLGSIFVVGTIVPSLSVCARRLHDTGSSGWLCLIKVPAYGLAVGGHVAAEMLRNPPPISDSLVNVLSSLLLIAVTGFVCTALVVFIILIKQGTAGPNRYGPDPYGPGDLEEVFA